MKVLVWQWGRFGAGPRVAAELDSCFNRLPRTQSVLSLASGAEILSGPDAPACALPMRTYQDLGGAIGRVAASPLVLPRLTRAVRDLAPDIALCAMPGPLDLLMGAALRRAGVPYAVVVHDADPHPGDGFPLQMTLQRALLRHADLLVALSGHVAERLREQRRPNARRLLQASLPPLSFGPVPPPPLSHGGRLRLLSFGRLLPYKGLDLLADSLQALLPRDDLEVRVVGSGPESPELARLRALPGVAVENRWVPEAELGALLAWSDALVLSHREASQSGVAAAALAAGRWIVATRVGGLSEQLGGQGLARLCEPDASSLAGALRGLLDDPPPPGDPSGLRSAWQADASRLVSGLRERLLVRRVPEAAACDAPSRAPLAAPRGRQPP